MDIPNVNQPNHNNANKEKKVPALYKISPPFQGHSRKKDPNLIPWDKYCEDKKDQGCEGGKDCNGCLNHVRDNLSFSEDQITEVRTVAQRWIAFQLYFDATYLFFKNAAIIKRYIQESFAAM